jgi:Golgi nucleoside diphosphatase
MYICLVVHATATLLTGEAGVPAVWALPLHFLALGSVLLSLDHQLRSSIYMYLLHIFNDFTVKCINIIQFIML